MFFRYSLLVGYLDDNSRKVSLTKLFSSFVKLANSNPLSLVMLLNIAVSLSFDR